MRRYLDIEPDPFPVSPRISIVAAAKTDCGMERTNNEDSAVLADLGNGRTFEPPSNVALTPHSAFVGLVCDGMGGEAGGEVASRLAIETIIPHLRATTMMMMKDDTYGGGESSTTTTNDNIIARGLIKSIEFASQRIRDESRQNPHLARMGTTATLAAITTARALVCAQVGDSRAYLLRDNALSQITVDQTLAEMLRRNAPGGALENVDEVVGAHVILQAVGSSTNLEVAITFTPLEDDDVILLCSDGLSGVVPDDLIQQTLIAHRNDPNSACDALVRRALNVGAPDNVTCIVISIRPAQAPQGSPQ
jgi:PPM family protein phosphatase